MYGVFESKNTSEKTRDRSKGISVTKIGCSSFVNKFVGETVWKAVGARILRVVKWKGYWRDCKLGGSGRAVPRECGNAISMRPLVATEKNA